MKPPHLCNCGRIVPHGTRCQCKQKADRERKQRHDRKRPSARERGYNRAWDIARREFLLRRPNCQFPGCDNPSSVVDHITPHKGDPRLFWDRTNWQALCARCHNSRKQKQERSR
ncbi:HNH endonuclease signature motif containing protein [Gellertiella hungarica]|uniref:5-methylcytosine-specific restriction endonuclease McrA n=1 Tax=Gellertiella hungarica TaxID=1572859 RepID=A0A7W6J9C7_9HYPH|nr:HNH endonuclease signature motif containing protein [Gellertiella hungarica]MBB4067171.1 5-methylcytosine-specific restriction endonuclease McrA [Gellertiella hungarica]